MEDIIRNTQNIFEHEEEENYYRPVRVNNFSSENYIQYESKGEYYQLKNILIKLVHI